MTQIKYNRDGDLLFSTAKDQQICAWYSHNGERLGTYKGHQGAIWTVDVDPTSTMIASGSADNTIRLWEVRTGNLLKTWDFPTAVKRVEFSDDGRQLLGVTEKRMGHLGTIVVLDINPDLEAEQSDERALTIVCDDSKATVAGWSYLNKYIIAGHEDGSVSQYDAKVCLIASPLLVFQFLPNLFIPTNQMLSLSPSLSPDRRAELQRPRPRTEPASHRPAVVARPDLLHHRLQG